jgi:hypothetical protein
LPWTNTLAYSSVNEPNKSFITSKAGHNKCFISSIYCLEVFKVAP